jgi:hypothetical protein
MGRWRVLREPTVPILLLACVVHAVRRNLFDLLLFGGTAALIVIDSWRAGPGPVTRATRRSPIWATLAVLAFAVLAGPLAQSGTGIRVVLVAVGLVSLALVVMVRAPSTAPVVGPGELEPDRGRGAGSTRGGKTGRDPGPGSGSLGGWWVWAALGALACLWELTSFAIQQADPASDAAQPTASDLIGPLLGSCPGRMVFLALWAAAGWWLLRRMVDAPQHPGPAVGRRGAARRAGTAGPGGDDAGTRLDVHRPEQAAGGAEAGR